LESRFVKEYPVAGQPTPRSVSDIVQSARTKLRSKNLADYESSVADKSERARINVKAGLGETLEGFQPVEPKAPLEFGEEVVPPPEVQAGQGLDYLMKVKQIQADLAKQGVDLPRETAVKLANLAPEEFVRARQQLIDSTPKTEKTPAGELEVKSLQELDPAFFPPGQDFPQGTPQRIAAEGLEGWANKTINEYRGQAGAGMDPIVNSARLVKTGFIAGRKIAATVRDLKEWSDKMIAELGDSIKPHLDEIWNGIRSDPVMDVFGKMIPGATKGIQDRFIELHEAQRYGGPEGMFDPQNNPNVDFGQGMWLNALEHVGDLVHRLSYSSSKSDFGGGGHGYGMSAALEKADRFIRKFSNKPGWMKIEDDVAQNIENNFNYRKKNGEFNGTLKEFQDEVKAAGERYAAEYEKLNPVTEMQKLGRDAAIDVGRFNFAAANDKLKKLSKMLNAPDAEKAYWTPMDKSPAKSVDSVVSWLEGRKLSEPGMTFSAETAIIVKSWDLAIDVAIAAIKAGASIAQATSRAIAEFKKNYPNASQDQVDLLAEEIGEMDSGSKKQREYVQNVWRPLLTDFSKSAIAQRKDAAGAAMRWFGETKVAQAIETGARLMKNAGTVADNIVNVLPAAKGVFSKMNQALSDALVLWTDKALPPIAEARKVFGDKFDDFSRLLISRTFTGDSTELDALVAATPGGAEILAKIESNEGWGGVREAMFNAEKNVRQGNDSFSKQADYYPLVVADGKLEDLLDMVSRHGDRHEVEKVLNQAKRDKAKETGNPGAELTREEQGAIIGKHLFGTLFQGRGAPGFTKKRNIGAITAEMAKFIEPIDVAIETRIMQVAKDVTARQFFGKIDTSGDNILPTDIESTSPFGLVLADAIKNNQITPEGIDVILDNVRDYFSNNRGASSAAWKFGRFIGDMAVYAHLNSFQSAFINASDAFSTAAREGPSAAGQALAAAVGKRISKIPGLSSFAPEDYTTLKDIKFHEGAMDTADYMRGSGAVKKFLRDSMKFIQGSMDTFGKEVALNAARINASNVMRGGDKERSFLATRDQQFERIQEVMSKTHPDVWPKMKKSLESEGFAKNDLDDMGRLYLRERLSDAQPMTRAEQAQGKLATHPGFKPIFALKSFMLRQIGTIRNNTYEELKKGNVAAAATWFGVYALWTMAGQVIVRCMVAKSLGKDCGGLDSWLSAFTGIFGMNKYSLSGLTRGDPAGTAIDMITPPLTPVNSLFKDVMLMRDTVTGRKMEGTNRPVVRNIGDFLKQAESYKHLPGGKDVYELVGAGRTKELKRQAEEKRGKKSSTITEELGKLILPPPKKSN
jgi:hypothetical protein